MKELERKLQQAIEGEVHFDEITRHVYSVDASIYEIEPIGVILPKTKNDILATIQLANAYNIPLIARGAATGITGGCIGKGLILDTSKYLNRILHIDFRNGFAICEPGVVQDRLNEALAVQGYRLGPDTSTGNRATLGGMVGNNAAGARSLKYGKMVDHVESIELAMASGKLLRFDSVSLDQWQQLASKDPIYKELWRIRTDYQDEIKKRFPHIPRRVSGYNLDTLLHPDHLNVSQMIVGAEGTLGIVTEIKVRICRRPQRTGLCILHLNDMIQAMQAIPAMLATQPISLEMIDHHILEMGAQAPSMRGKLDWLKERSQAIFVAEFEGDSSQEVSRKLDTFEALMQQHPLGFACSKTQDAPTMAHVWDIRKAGLGLLLSRKSYSRAIAFVEDLSVAPENLASFMQKFNAYLEKVGKTAGVYGHVGSGCMHLRPYIDLRKPEEISLLQNMMEDISTLVLEHGGALSGEHGDGLIRSWLNEKMFGKKLYQAFVDIKNVFDPHNLMNPGKIVNGPPVLENLRLSPATEITRINTAQDFSEEGGFELAVDLCNGNGQCRKMEGTMCPSFQATQNEFHSTRARAQALRDLIHGRLDSKEMAQPGLYDVLDLCLQCKGCKTECPSRVDMAKIKAEFLFHYQEKHGYSLRNRLFANIGRLNAIASPFAGFFNNLMEMPFTQLILKKMGISTHYSFPKLATERFSQWISKMPLHYEGKKVILFNDTYTEFYFPKIGQAAYKLLSALGYQVIVPEWRCCGRTLISKGFLKQAKTKATVLLNHLLSYIEEQIPIVGLEPSCLFTLKDDFKGLLPEKKELVEQLASISFTLEEFLCRHIENGQLPLKFKEDAISVKVHGHCHQKALIGMSPTLQLLKAIPAFTVEEIPSGCCGVAGSFGYELEHEAISRSIGELVLLPAVRNAPPDTLIIANGVSCRSQIQHGTKKRALHLAEALASFLE